MNLLRLAAFDDAGRGGNPAGVMLADALPGEAEMRRIAARIGYSETAFAMPLDETWRVRYFSPESEVPFCGHATIALGAALALEHGNDTYRLKLNSAEITVTGKYNDGNMSAALQSPPTHSEPMSPMLLAELLTLFGFTERDLYDEIPPAHVHAGANHLVLCLNSRARLAAMQYKLDAGRDFMNREGLLTILLGYSETPRLFHTRNPFASGGVYEDPATGTATAAFAGYLRDLGWPHQGSIEIVQGEDMGMRSRLRADIEPTLGSSIRVSGSVRFIGD